MAHDLRKTVEQIADESARRAVGSEKHLTTRDRLARGGSLPGVLPLSSGAGSPTGGQFTIGVSTIGGADTIA